ncbi:MAG: endolytic transglycosylase MltG [Deltaproteobacteria bacterium]|nr:endolytic transglycosylase MltG [Deltaproteobacteria bacterium]
MPIPLLVAGICILLLLYALLVFTLPPNLRGERRQVVIPQGVPFKGVARILDEGGLLRSPTGFYLMARLMGVTERVQAGEYELSTTMLPLVILHKLVTGDVMKYRITIPEGYTIRQIALRLKEEGIIEDEEQFLALAFSAEFVAGLGIEGKGVEGYLFPDTYLLPKGVSPIEIIKTMVGKFKQVYGPDFARRAAELGMTDREVVILASIIEKETGVSEERPLISAVFHNRLKRGIPLCSDPTVIYGIPDFDGNLRKRDLERKTPYNTYLKRGLPPGPIANPGRSSLLAALYPAPVQYLYFVSRNDGSHYFSTTLREHNEAVWQYQQGGKRSAN